MSSKKCHSCGLVNFASDEVCKRCNRPFSAIGGRAPRHKISTECPRCNSDNTQSFQMAYQTGTSFGRTAIVGVADDGGIGVASARTHGQTVLASRVKPPISGSGEAAVLAVIGIVVGSIIAIFVSMIIGIAFSGIFGIIAVNVGKGSALEKQSPETQAALRKWQQSWICLKCGNTWLIR